MGVECVKLTTVRSNAHVMDVSVMGVIWDHGCRGCAVLCQGDVANVEAYKHAGAFVKEGLSDRCVNGLG